MPRRIRGLVLSERVRHRIADRVAAEHPREAGGFLPCERRGGELHATGHVAVTNRAATPQRRFETVVDERAPPPPRVFYHSHTFARAPSGLSRLDERNIPEPIALVTFAPRGEILSFRAFRRALTRWRELTVSAPVGDGSEDANEPLPRLV